jgi:hypothetical protein
VTAVPPVLFRTQHADESRKIERFLGLENVTVAELLGGHVEAAIDWLHAVDPVETDPELPS